MQFCSCINLLVLSQNASYNYEVRDQERIKPKEQEKSEKIFFFYRYFLILITAYRF